ncbi:MAG: hypothetical protein Q8S31_06130 [Alphaproteobacteria bacterium]|nr:hypothetical protein [Alphaproteobacteria bacterium]
MNRLKYIWIFFFLLSSSAFSGISEEKIKESRKIAQFILNTIDNQFDHSSENEKRIIVSKKISNSYLRNLQLEYFDIDNLYQLDSRDPEVDTTNVLALAICLGDTNLLNKFLNYVDNINDSKYWVWGYGQSYTMAHLILDPQYPIRTDDISLEARLSIMDMLIQRGINFEIVPISISCHRNPALAAGEPGGNPINALVKNDNGFIEYQNIIDELRVRALLAGANPCVHGSSFFGLPIVSCPFRNGNYEFDQPRKIFAKYDSLSWNYYVNIISKQVTAVKISSSFKPILHYTLVDAVMKHWLEASN